MKCDMKNDKEQARHSLLFAACLLAIPGKCDLPVLTLDRNTPFTLGSLQLNEHLMTRLRRPGTFLLVLLIYWPDFNL